MRPVIGITCYVETARWGLWEQEVSLLPQRYVAHVAAAGARPVVLPPLAEGAAETVAALDGLVLAGGADIDPSRYDARPHPRTTGIRPDRDLGEFVLAGAAVAADLPVLGICRGMQLLTVLCGGTLHQHLPDVVGHEGHRPAPGVYADHPVRIAPDSQLAGILGESATVKSYHHQGIATVGELTNQTAWAEDDTIEAIEVEGRRFALGVLWHPEQDDDPRLFQALVEAAKTA